jgi:hypothetical protein
MARLIAASSSWLVWQTRRCSFWEFQKFGSAAQPAQFAFPVADLGDGQERHAAQVIGQWLRNAILRFRSMNSLPSGLPLSAN